mgnify:CR=1 FL=1
MTFLTATYLEVIMIMNYNCTFVILITPQLFFLKEGMLYKIRLLKAYQSSLNFNPIRPDPFEFLIGLSVCLWDTRSLTTIWNELEGCNFACRFDFTHFEDPSIQIWKIAPFRVEGRGYEPISKP